MKVRTILAFTMNYRLRFKPTTPEMAQAAHFRGVYSAVAKKLGVSPQHVRNVDLGVSTSRRVSVAIKREVSRRIALRDRERAA